MLDTTPVTTEITRLISTGTTEQAILVAVTHLFPELTPAELSEALQVATTAAERRAVRPHCAKVASYRLPGCVKRFAHDLQCVGAVRRALDKLAGFHFAPPPR
jgi:hypothetical protein